MRTVTGVFPSRTKANLVARDLNLLGIPIDEITIADNTGASSHEWSRRNLAAAGGAAFGWFIAGLIPKVAERSRAAATGFGAAVGAGVGAVAGLLAVAIPTLTNHAVVPIVASHVIPTMLTAIAVGAAGCGLAAGIYNMGVSHEGIPLREEALREHGVVVAAQVDISREPDAIDVMSRHGARNIRADADAWLASGWSGKHNVEKPYPSDSSFRSHAAGE